MVTKRQKEVLAYIDEYKADNGYSPSLNDLKDHLNLTSVSTAHYHVKNLEELGLLRKGEHQPRSLSTILEHNTIRVPIVGTITAGLPIEAIEEFESSIFIDKHNFDLNDTLYALKVKGDSMQDDGIFDGDIVVLKKQNSAENGQTVVAIIDDNQATLKKIYRLDKRYKLEPANKDMLPFYRKEVEIRGVVVHIIRNLQTTPKLQTLDLFAGIGGLRLGFEQAGFETAFANDYEKQCKKTYDSNFSTCKLIIEDIRKIEPDDLPHFDFLLAGFPCQPFSVAGYRDGFNDKQGRGDLFFYIAKIIEERKPQGFLLENVKNMKGHDQGKTFTIIKKTLEELGYHLKSKVMNSMEYGNVPQNRERIYIVGFREKSVAENFIFPNKIPLTTKVTDLLDTEVSDKYYYNGKPLYKKIKNDITTIGTVYQWRRKYVRENKSGVCPTLTANMGTGGHNVPIIKDHQGIRKLTPIECARLQGFPQDYTLPDLADSTLYKQFGNSVTVSVVKRIAREIARAIESNGDDSVK